MKIQFVFSSQFVQHLSQITPGVILLYYSMGKGASAVSFLFSIRVDNGQLLAICNACEQEQGRLTHCKKEKNIGSATHPSAWSLYVDQSPTKRTTPACRQAGVFPEGELVLWYRMFAPSGVCWEPCLPAGRPGLCPWGSIFSRQVQKMLLFVFSPY
jgi:hypothetical protein